VVAVSDFHTRYGGWAVVAGASEGIGAAFAKQLAARGLHIVLVARRAEPLAELASWLEASYGVVTRVIALDLADADAAARLVAATADLDVGMLVCNAALARMAPFFETSVEDLGRMVDLNCRTPLLLTHAFGQKMQARGRGGVVLLSSLGALISTPFGATYAATKAFNAVLAESLYGENTVVDVVACVPGPTRTPTFDKLGSDGLGTLSAEQVADETLQALGRHPRSIPGRMNRVIARVMSGLPRRWAIGLVASQMRKFVVKPHH